MEEEAFWRKYVSGGFEGVLSCLTSCSCSLLHVSRGIASSLVGSISPSGTESQKTLFSSQLLLSEHAVTTEKQLVQERTPEPCLALCLPSSPPSSLTVCVPVPQHSSVSSPSPWFPVCGPFLQTHSYSGESNSTAAALCDRIKRAL